MAISSVCVSGTNRESRRCCRGSARYPFVAVCRRLRDCVWWRRPHCSLEFSTCRATTLCGALFEFFRARARSEFLLAEIAIAVGVDTVETLADAALYGGFAAADLAVAVAIQRFEDDFHVLGAAYR